jgi:putative oxidoreductase
MLPPFNHQDLGKLLLRLTCGGILLFHGFHKVFIEIDHVKKIVEGAGLPAWVAYGNIIGEFVAPLMVIVGYKTRIGALIIVFNMLMSIVLAHRDIIFSVNDFGGWMIETNVLYLMTAYVVFLLGSGHYSLTRGKGMWD